MNTNKIFKGLSSKQRNEALTSHNEHLKNQYNAKIKEITEAKATELNIMATEAKEFITSIIELLKANVKSSNPKAINTVKNHIEFLK